MVATTFLNSSVKAHGQVFRFLLRLDVCLSKLLDAHLNKLSVPAQRLFSASSNWLRSKLWDMEYGECLPVTSNLHSLQSYGPAQGHCLAQWLLRKSMKSISFWQKSLLTAKLDSFFVYCPWKGEGSGYHSTQLPNVQDGSESLAPSFRCLFSLCRWVESQWTTP